MQTAQRPPLSQLIIYALGQFGWSLASFGAANLLVYFYLPPEEVGQSAVFPAFIYQGAVLGVMTLIGTINFSSRLFDAITDPLIAAFSDKRPRKGGKRKRLLAVAALPFAALSFLIFWPPVGAESAWNSVWLVVSVMLFYLFLTLYVVPYNALISELGHHPPDRMRISTLISITWALGFVVGGTAYSLQGYFEQFTDSTQAFQWTMGLFAAVAFIAMMIPVIGLKEERYTHQPPVESIPIRQAVQSVLGDQSFRYFIFSDLLYWVALTFIQQGVSYYVTALFGLPKEQATVFLTISFLGSFALYWPINALVKRFEKGVLLRTAFWVFFSIFALTALIRPLALPQQVLFYGLALLSAFPLAAFGIIPNALVADYIYQHEKESGSQQAGMFYAVRNFMMKAGVMIASLIFPSLLLLGRTPENPYGIETSAWVACVFCVLGWWLFRRAKVK